MQNKLPTHHPLPHTPRHRRTEQSQYYLPHPQAYPQRETDMQQQPRQKVVLKCPRRKQSQNFPLTSPILKFEHNHSKELEQNPSKSSTRKLQKKARSSSSGETPKKPLAKSSLKLQLTSRREGGVPKRVTLHLDVPTTKKPPGKLTLQEMNYDSYYSTRPPLPDSKSPHPLPLTLPRSSTPVSADMKHLLSRCQAVLTDYSIQLQSIRRSNAVLEEQNRVLRGSVERE